MGDQAPNGGVFLGSELSHESHTEVEIQDLELFVDAAISTSTEIIGLGAVIFSANMRAKTTLSKPLEGTLSVLHVKELALLVGLLWTQRIGLPIKRILSDSLSLVQALNNAKVYDNEMTILLTDIKMVLSNFSGATISHVNRKFNVVAHNLSN